MACMVYELVNPDLKEVFIGASCNSVESELAKNRAAPPSAIAHWPLEYRRKLKILELFETPAEMESYLKAAPRRLEKGYKLITSGGWEVSHDVDGLRAG